MCLDSLLSGYNLVHYTIASRLYMPERDVLRLANTTKESMLNMSDNQIAEYSTLRVE